jgi:nucleoside-diphosphate-sugar epimerase
MFLADQAHAPADLRGVDAIIHLAARAHVMKETANDPLDEYRAANVRATLTLAQEATRSAVKRFVFVSSIGVNGKVTHDAPFTESDPPAPIGSYALSKWEAEQQLRQIERTTGLEVAIVRPPLVYGPGVKGNLLALLRWVARGIPLPVGAIRNQRSLIGVDNLCDLLLTCASHPAARGRLFLAADGEDVSTPELLEQIAAGLGRPSRIPRVPLPFVRLLARAAGRRSQLEQLCASLVVDATCAREVLGWQPRERLSHGIRRMCEWYASERRQ